MNPGRIAFVNVVLPRCLAIDVLQRQRHFDQFLFVSHALKSGADNHAKAVLELRFEATAKIIKSRVNERPGSPPD